MKVKTSQGDLSHNLTLQIILAKCSEQGNVENVPVRNISCYALLTRNPYSDSHWIEANLLRPAWERVHDSWTGLNTSQLALRPAWQSAQCSAIHTAYAICWHLIRSVLLYFDFKILLEPSVASFLNHSSSFNIRSCLGIASYKFVDNLGFGILHMCNWSSPVSTEDNEDSETKEDSEEKFVTEMKTVILNEFEAQDKLTVLGHNYKIKTSKWKRLSKVERLSGFRIDAQREIIGGQQSGQRYKITSDSTVFLKKKARSYHVPGSDEDRWQINIVMSLPNFNTEAQLMILSKIKSWIRTHSIRRSMKSKNSLILSLWSQTSWANVLETHWELLQTTWMRQVK